MSARVARAPGGLAADGANNDDTVDQDVVARTRDGCGFFLLDQPDD